MIPDFLIEKALQAALEFLKGAIQEEIENQGHKATGNLIESIEIKIQRTADGFKGQIFMQDYAFILDKGVKANRVPYNRGSGKKTSKYIDALMVWISVIKPSMGARERKSFAFAIANKAKQEGHPTKGSFAFSRNGRRREWAKYAIDNNIQQLENILDLGNFVAVLIDNAVTDFQKLIVN